MSGANMSADRAKSEYRGVRSGRALRPLLGVIFLVFAACGGSPTNPIDEFRTTMKGEPTFSIILEDMNETGFLFKDYYHKYKIVTPEKTNTTDWREVSSNFYNANQPFLGLTIFSKQDGKEQVAAGPPGYEYVNNPRYGHWETNSSGQSFWTFYGQYRLISDLLGPRQIFRSDYDSYNGYHAQSRPYYGPNREYGTDGSLTRAQKPDFFSRRASRSSASSSSFDSKVSERAGRTRSSSSSSSGSSSRGGGGSGGK